MQDLAVLYQTRHIETLLYSPPNKSFCFFERSTKYLEQNGIKEKGIVGLDWPKTNVISISYLSVLLWVPPIPIFPPPAPGKKKWEIIFLLFSIHQRIRMIYFSCLIESKTAFTRGWSSSAAIVVHFFLSTSIATTILQFRTSGWNNVVEVHVCRCTTTISFFPFTYLRRSVLYFKCNST